MNYLILLLAFLPIVVEIPVDKKLWEKGKNDKPITTILRYLMFLGLSTIIATFGVLTWWQAFIFIVAVHVTFFDAGINKFNLKKGIFYHPETNGKSISDRWEKFWRGIAGMRWGKPIYVFLRLWILWVGFLLSFKWDLAQGDFITVGTWWEKISQFFMF